MSEIQDSILQQKNKNSVDMNDDDDNDSIATPPSGVIRLNVSKAGMEGLDLDRINKIINDTSRGSKFYEHKKKNQEQLRKKVADMQAQVATFSAETLAKAEKQADVLAKQLEDKRDLSRIIVHLDMDAFYASVEMRDNPSLKFVPMAVGGNSMLCTSNYHARKYGVRAGMPGFIAKKICPDLTIVPVNFAKYTAASKEVEQVLVEYDTETLSVSMDEAVFDISRCLEERNSFLSGGEQAEMTASELVEEIRAKVFENTKLTVSAGIAANGLLAKICSDINKPNNQYYLECSIEAIEKFMTELPVRKVCGIGPVTEVMLKGLDIQTCGDLWKKRGIIQLLFKPATASFLLAASKGVGGSFMSQDPSSEGDDVRKSISCERTFGKANKEELKQMCHDLSEELQKDLEKKGATGKTIALKIKTTHFDVKTRARSIAEYTSNASTIYKTAWSIYISYEQEIPNLQLRLMGVRISNLRFLSDEDDAENGGIMKQQTLSQLFNKPKKYTCPCCEQEFGCMRGLGTHLDNCLPFSNNNTEVKQEMTGENGIEEDNHGENGLDTTCHATCPVCNRSIKFKSEEEIEIKMNTHIDECLNVSVMKSIMREETTEQDAQTQSQMPCSSKSIFTPVSGQTTSKRHLDQEDDQVPVNPTPTKLRAVETLDDTPTYSRSKSTNALKSKPSKGQPPIDSFFKRN